MAARRLGRDARRAGAAAKTTGTRRRRAFGIGEAYRNQRPDRWPADLVTVRRVRAGALAGDRRDLDREGDGVADGGHVGEVRASETALDPAGEEPATERIAGTDRVHDRDLRARRPRPRRVAVTTMTARPPSVSRTTAGPRPTIARAASMRRRARLEIGEVVGADLDDVGAGHDAVEPIEVGRAVRDDRRPAVRVEHDQRVGRWPRRRPRPAPRPSAPAPARASRGGTPGAESRGPPRRRRVRACGAEVSAVWKRYVAAPRVVEFGDGQGRRRVRRPGERQVHAVGRERLAQGRRRTDRSTGSRGRRRPAEPGDRPGRVERPAARGRREPAVRVDEQVDERLAGHDDHGRHGTCAAYPRPTMDRLTDATELLDGRAGRSGDARRQPARPAADQSMARRRRAVRRRHRGAGRPSTRTDAARRRDRRRRHPGRAARARRRRAVGAGRSSGSTAGRRSWPPPSSPGRAWR